MPSSGQLFSLQKEERNNENEEEGTDFLFLFLSTQLAATDEKLVMKYRFNVWLI